MRTKIFSFLTLGLLLSLASCDINNGISPSGSVKKEVFSGYVQKGPYINGSSVMISELDASLNQTGRSYSTTVADNSGSFEQKKIELVSNYVQLKADGYYFNEVTGESSSGQLTLYALADISAVNSANVNVLTHLETSRVEYLVQQKGLAFAAAKKQAQREVLNIFSLTLPTDSTSESLNLSGTGENNAVLLAVSCILQGVLSTADMSELMGNIIADIKTDGVLDNASLGSELIDNARLISLPSVREHLVAKYAELGLNVTIPNFETKVQEFISKTSYKEVVKITYPVSGHMGLNILNDTVQTVYQDRGYAMKADLPNGTNLRIVLKGPQNTWNYADIPVTENWTIKPYDQTSQSQEFVVNNSNETNDVYIVFNENFGNAITIEYYENNSLTPTRVKQLQVGNSAPVVNYITYPPTGNSGENILSDSVSVTRGGKIYSINAQVPQTKTLKVILKGGTWVCNPTSAAVNWTIGSYDSTTQSQEFTVTESGKTDDMGITFTSSGTYTIEYYEDNATTPTRVRHFTQS